MNYFFKLPITQNVLFLQLSNVKTKNQSRLNLQFMYWKCSSIFIQKKVIRENIDKKTRFYFPSLKYWRAGINGLRLYNEEHYVAGIMGSAFHQGEYLLKQVILRIILYKYLNFHGIEHICKGLIVGSSEMGRNWIHI